MDDSNKNKLIKLENLNKFKELIIEKIISPIVTNITNLQKSLENKAEKTHNHTIKDVTNLQTTLDSKAPEKYNLYYTGAISSKFKEKIIGTTDECGFVKSFRKQDNTDTCMPQYGSGVAWGQSDSFGMLYSNYEKPIAYVAGGSTNGLRWSKQLAWKDDITNLQTTLDSKASSTHNHDFNSLSNLPTTLSGYGITNVYTKTEINNKINSKTNVQSGEIITTNNDTIGYFKNIKINGNTRYKKSDKTYTDTWESGVSLESMGEKEKDSNNKYPIEIVSRGKNLCKYNNMVKTVTSPDGNIVARVPLEIGRDYFISGTSKKTGSIGVVDGFGGIIIFCSNVFYDINTNFNYNAVFKGDYGDAIIYENASVDLSKKIKASKKYLYFYVGSGFYNVTFQITNLQVEEGTQATNYEPYKEDKRTVLLDSPLRKVGTIADVLDLEKMKVTRNCGVKTLDGSETWGKESLTRTNTSLFYLSLTSSIFAKVGKCLSDKLSYNYNIYSTDEEGIRIDANGNLQISILKSKLATDNVTGFKTWLVSNNVTVVYQLATPITEDIEVSSNTLTDFATSCTLTIDNTIKGNIECNEVVGLIPSVEENGTRLANVEKSLENKAEKNHNHDNSYLKLSGGTMTGTIGFPQGVGIESATNAGKGLLKETSTSVNVGFTGKSIRLYGSSISYNDSSGNKYDIYHSGNLRVGGVNNIVNGGFTNGTNGYKPNENTTLTIVDDSASYTGKALKLICPKSNGGIFRWVSSASDSTKTTISFYAKKDSATSSLSITFGFEGIKMANAPLTDKWQRFALTIDAQQGQMLIYTLGAGTFFIHSIKVESGDRYTDWNYANQELVTTKDITTLFERNNGTINKNINTCFASSSGTFTAPEAGQYLVMCSGYKLSNSNMYIACVVGGENSNRNELYTTGSSGFTLITLSAKQTLMLYECPTGNISNTCISSNSAVNMLIARIK